MDKNLPLSDDCNSQSYKSLDFPSKNHSLLIRFIKRATLLVGIFLFAWSIQAQEHVSFEADEGFSLGNINGQNGWYTTPVEGGGNITNQVVSDTYSSQGQNALKIAIEPSYGVFPSSIIGAYYDYPQGLDYTNLAFSFDIYIDTPNQAGGSKFVFQAASTEAQSYQVYLSFFFTGQIFVFEPDSGNYYSNLIGNWYPHTWYHIDIVLQGETATYKINGEEVYEGDNWAFAAIDQIHFGHNNNLGDAYIDNYSMGTVEEMGVEKVESQNFNYYISHRDLFLQANQSIDNVVIYDLTGREVMTVKPESNLVEMDLNKLNAGIYLVKMFIGKQLTSFKIILD